MNKLVAAVVLAFAVGGPIMAYTTGEIPGVDKHLASLGMGIRGGELASLDAAKEWLNSPPLTAPSLRGKVVLVDFWTYSCINWRRELPYVRAWAEKYKDRGLVVIGVHTPEFDFEKDVAGIRTAAREMNVPYPVVVDSDYRIWNAFRNQYWPALYFIDAQGRVRHSHFGEGDYASSERMLRKLLEEAGSRDLGPELVSVEGRGLEAPPDWDRLRTAETYLGRARASGAATLSKEWTVERQRAVSRSPGARIAMRFHARDLHLVMGPSAAPVRFRVLLDGKPPGADRGDDVDENGYGTATKRTLYQLIRQKGAVADRRFEIEFLDAGAEAYSFTFG